MTDVTMIGLGAMGSALASAFIGAGHGVTVWNRTSSKVEPLAALGAITASSISNAVEASSIIVVCIDNYKISRNLISENDLGQYLSGRILIQLSTGTPKEAHEFEDLIHSFSCEYLDGAIMPYPEGIGDEDAKLLFSGPEETYTRCQPVLSCLGGDLRYLGSNIRGAATLDKALLTHDLCCYLGVIHGSHICESEDISVGEFASMFPEGSLAREPVDVIHSGVYDEPGATLAVWDGALQRIQTQAIDSDINSEVPDFISSFFKRALAAGYGEEDVASIIKVMRGGNVA
jgi:3-hydroxyisobutyrate dehydrogenase-like beta-hydroxyacid dehydrogenase